MMVGKSVLLLSAALIGGQAIAADGNQPATTTPNYGVNWETRAAVVWHALEKPIDRGLVIDILVNGQRIKAAIDTGGHPAGLLELKSSAAARLASMGASKSKQKRIPFGSER